jgi:anti-sigma factor RsiW
MDYEAQLKLQAYLDGELPENEQREVANWLARDQEAVALLGELRQTRKAMAGFEDGIRLPESREFYWSKIRREIERQEPVRPQAPPAVSLLARLRRWLVPAAGVATVILAGLLMLPSSDRTAPMETALADSSALIYHDYPSKATFVFLSYPAEDEFATADEMDEID